MQYGRPGCRPIPPFTDEHQTLRESIRRFVADELRPHAAEWEQARGFPDEVFAKLAAVGFAGLKSPEQYEVGSPARCAPLSLRR